jgi:primosomal protein N' (replication factor Y) (superfamily II helicase)
VTSLELNIDAPEGIETFFADVILPLPLPRLYTYRVPRSLNSSILPGARVIVQFGKKKILTAVVAAIHQNPPQVYEAKYILELLDEEPMVNSHQLKLFQWMAEYYMCTLGEVLNASLPAGLKLSSQSKIQLNPDFKDDKIEFSEKENFLIEALHNSNTLTYDEAARVLGQKNIHTILKSLTLKHRILLFEEIREKYTPKIIKKIRLHSDYNSKSKLEELFKKLEKKSKQTDVLLKYLQKIPLYNNKELNNSGIDKNILSNSVESVSGLSTLLKNKIFEEFEVIVSRFEENISNASAEVYLNEDQISAKDQILEHFKSKEVVLLHGITGSGKTEIFIQLIQKALEGGSQVLYLLPEIALTTQIVTRLQKIFGSKIGVYHSKFSDNERVEVWKGILSGKFSFVIGVRSSIFLPFDNLGLIIIDEEHESSYKQYDPAPRYHARDTALVLAKMHNAKTLLGSATPSIESYYNSKEGKWGLVTLKKRFGEAQLPEIILTDTRRERKHKRMKNDFSVSLLEAIQQSLDKKEQSILFQNRRGYSPYLSCEDCAHIPKCENCAVSLTYHMYLNELRCHYCGHAESVPSTCEACGSSKIKTIGYGTEKIEDEIKLFFPNANVQRMDLDTTRKKNSYQKIIHDFENRLTDILVGTQMVSKGLDFDHVNLVGIFDADRMIHFPDFRSHERAFQMITQVSGRAGRRDIKGKVIIQTNDPGQAIFSKIINHDYDCMYEEEIKERQKYKYPPFVRMIKLTIKDVDKKACYKAATDLSEKLISQLGKSRVLGPQAPLIDRLRNYYLMDVLIKIEKGKVNSKSVKEIIEREINNLLILKEFKNSYVVADVDPV